MTTERRLQVIGGLSLHRPKLYGEGDNDGIPSHGPVDRMRRLHMLVDLLEMRLEPRQFQAIEYLWDYKGRLSAGVQDFWHEDKAIVETLDSLWDVLDGYGGEVEIYRKPPWGWV